MKIVSIILTMLILSGVITFFNEFNLFGIKGYNPGFSMNNSSVAGIAQVDTSSGAGTSDWWSENIPGIGLASWFLKMGAFLWETLKMVYNLPGILEQYIPGVVGHAFGVLIQTMLVFIVGWSLLQIYLKISTKYMD